MESAVTMSTKLQFRPAIPSDESYLFATWLRRGWFEKGSQTGLPRHVWFGLARARLKKMIAESPPTIAHLVDEPDVIVGWTIKDGKGQFVHVKRYFRDSELGVAEALTNQKEGVRP
jgi:hypothetical protein